MGIDAAYGIGSLKQGVCTSSTRPASPYTGQTIYETDTTLAKVWNGTAWVEYPPGKADLASPTFTGTPAAPTATAGTNTTQLATTAFVTTADNLKANLASPTFTGTPAAPTATAGTNTTQLATMASRPWNTAWGYLGIHTRTDIFNSSSPHTTAQDEGLSCSVSYGANRLLKVTLLVRPYTPGGQNFVSYRLLRGSTTVINWGNGYPEISNSEAPCKTLTYTFVGPATSGTETFKIQIYGAANTQVTSYATAATSDGPRQLLVEDIGPA